MGVWGFLYECPLHCPAQLGGSLVTICQPRLCPAGVRSALLLPALPCCCSLRPTATGYTLRRSLSVVAGCLSNRSVTSVGMDCLGNGRRPSPTELRPQGTPPQGAFGITVLFVPLCYPKCCHPGISWLAHCPSPIQSQVQPSQVSGCQPNRAPGRACFVQTAV